ncbi:MAG: site-specific integrase, partial [Candidatus Marinamargulisbacteria bacterium]
MIFTEYLTIECHLAQPTVAAYDSDVRHFKVLIQKEVPNDADMVTYLNRLTDDGFATTSIQRKVSAIKLYLFFLRVKQGVEVPDMATLFQPKTSLQLPKLIPSKSLALAVSFSFEGQKQAYRNRLIIALLYY